jgi:type VI secretion system protein ImpF
MSAPLPTAALPLFDRLCPEAAGLSAGAGRVGPRGDQLDARGLQASLARDLARLLGTRSPLDSAGHAGRRLSVIDYGLPDLTALWPRSSDDRRRLQQAVEHALHDLEPRLQRTRVQVRDDPEAPQRLRLQIEAAVQLGAQWHRVAFDLGIEPGRPVSGSA